MYQLEILPIANNDMINIVRYINYKLYNSTASNNLINSFYKTMQSITIFPYGISIYETYGKLTNEYRCVRIKNYLMFYTIDENKKIITIIRVLYYKRSINDELE